MIRWRLHFGHGGLGAFGVVLVLTLAAAVGTQANLLFWIGGLLVAAALLSLMVSLLALRGLEVRRLPPAHAVAGQAVTIHYRLSRPGRRWPLFNAVIRETGPARSGPADSGAPMLDGEPIGWVPHVGRDEPVIASTIGRPLRRGLLRLEAVEIATSFPFGILRSTLRVHQVDEVPVYPRRHRLRDRVLGSMDARGGSDGPTSIEPGGQEEFYGLREYRSGDSVRGIDWKHSARLDRLITREMTRSAPRRLWLLLDMDRRHLTRLAAEHRDQWIEDAIALTASLIVEGHRQGIAVGLRILGFSAMDFEARHSRPHCDAMLRALAVLDAGQSQEAPLPRGLSQRSTLRIVPGPAEGTGQGPVLASADLARLTAGSSDPPSTAVSRGGDFTAHPAAGAVA